MWKYFDIPPLWKNVPRMIVYHLDVVFYKFMYFNENLQDLDANIRDHLSYWRENFMRDFLDGNYITYNHNFLIVCNDSEGGCYFTFENRKDAERFLNLKAFW